MKKKKDIFVPNRGQKSAIVASIIECLFSGNTRLQLNKFRISNTHADLVLKIHN